MFIYSIGDNVINNSVKIVNDDIKITWLLGRLAELKLNIILLYSYCHGSSHRFKHDITGSPILLARMLLLASLCPMGLCWLFVRFLCLYPLHTYMYMYVHSRSSSFPWCSVLLLLSISTKCLRWLTLDHKVPVLTRKNVPSLATRDACGPGTRCQVPDAMQPATCLYPDCVYILLVR